MLQLKSRPALNNNAETEPAPRAVNNGGLSQCSRTSDTPLYLSSRAGAFAGRTIQRKLYLGAADDPAEAEADRAAAAVVSGSGLPAYLLGGGCCRDCDPGAVPPRPPAVTAIRRTPGPGEGAAPAGEAAESAIASLGAGTPLPGSERAFFEPRFGEDFSSVRIHVGGGADLAARVLGARAFTLGSDIGFAAGEYRPGDSEGRRLLAHELAHTLQQGHAVRAEPNPQAKCAGVACGEDVTKDHVFRALPSGCTVPKMAEAIKGSFPDLYEGRLQVYANAVLAENNIANAKSMQAGLCLKFMRGWKDPNIGDIDAELIKLKGAASTGFRHKIIATVYSEQTDAGMDEQRKYIFYSMLLRIRSEGYPATLAKAVTQGTYHGMNPDDSTNYAPALEYLKGRAKLKELEAAKKTGSEEYKALEAEIAALKVDAAALNNAEAAVAGATAKGIPADAGIFYFHWRKGSTAAAEYTKALPKNATKDQELEAEKKAAYIHFVTVVKGASRPTVVKDWSKKIRGSGSDDRIGSMYIYKE